MKDHTFFLGEITKIRKYIDERMRAQKNKSTVYVRDGHRLLLVVGCFLSDLIAVEARPVVFFAIGFIDVFGI